LNSAGDEKSGWADEQLRCTHIASIKTLKNDKMKPSIIFTSELRNKILCIQGASKLRAVIDRGTSGSKYKSERSNEHRSGNSSVKSYRGRKFKSTLYYKAGSVSMMYETVFTNIC
jgi:hypothetical protein